MQNKAFYNNITSNISLKLLSILIAVVLWFAVLGSRNVEVSKEIPIEVITPPDLIIANDVPEKVLFRMSGPKAFLRNVLNRKEEPIRINFSTAKPGFTTYRLFQDNIQVPIGVKVLSVNPAAIVVNLEPFKRKDVTVKLVTKGETLPGYTIQKLELVNSNVSLKGPESKMNLLTEVMTMPVDLSEITESGIREVTLNLSAIPGVLVEGALPRLQTEVTHAESSFKIRNADVRVQADGKYSVDPKEVTIYVKCSPEELRQVNRGKVFGMVDVRGKSSGVHEVEVKVQLPGTIRLMKVVPSKVKVTLK